MPSPPNAVRRRRFPRTGYSDVYRRVRSFANMRISAGDTAPGEPEPSEEDLKRSGGTPLDRLSRLVSKRADEIYNEFDFTDRSTASMEPFLVSYGESVSRCEGMDFQPFIRQAKQFADFYHGVIRKLAASACSEPVQMIRRRWYCATDPNLVTVKLLFHSAI